MSRRRRASDPQRVGLFGLLGAGNVGNDGSLEAVLDYLRAEHPDAVLDCLCSGPRVVAARYGIPTTPLYWYYARQRAARGPAAAVLKLAGKVRDAGRVLRWVRRFDVVIVPGTGVLENTLPVRPWGFPFSLFLLCVGARLSGTKVALVNVGSNVIHQRSVRFLYRTSARLAHYRSFRDELSRDAMRDMGVDTTGDDIYPDLVFALPVPPQQGGDGRVGVGVMDFHGGSDDRAQADRIHRDYVAAMKRFVRWLVDGGRRVRLLTGDVLDQAVVREILDDLRVHRPDLDPAAVVAELPSSLADLMRQIASVDLVVATRYHNVICALGMAKPTISVSYSTKSDRIMADMGLAGFCQDARAVDVDRLVEQFGELERRQAELRGALAGHAASKVRRLREQYAVLSATLFPPRERPATPTKAAADVGSAP